MLSNPPMNSSQFDGFFRDASLIDLKAKGMIVVPETGCPVLLCWSEGRAFALDNRCPHMGFPLSKGSLETGLLTCHWHHAQFDINSGCTFDLWADDAPVFDVRLQGDDVWVAERPRHKVDVNSYSRRLVWGLEQNIGLIQAQGMVAVLAEEEERTSDSI